MTVSTDQHPFQYTARVFFYCTILLLVVAGVIWHRDQVRSEVGFFVSGKDADVCLGVIVLGCPIGMGILNMSVIGVGVSNICILCFGLHNIFAIAAVGFVNDFVFAGVGHHISGLREMGIGGLIFSRNKVG